ncbi:hypothetical protein L218DRAFT_862409 [Marasmius fiardii PR-910]|nr:hypothetical protein L218DRAFT_862409 [Marasmius fiardii PR-910]
MSTSILLDEEGDITELLENCLKRVFGKYCTPSSTSETSDLPEDAYLSLEGLNQWAIDTNGEPFSKETKDELFEFLDVNEQGYLTFKGFLQIYQLQTENDEEETWRDLVSCTQFSLAIVRSNHPQQSRHGFDRSLKSRDS